MGPEVLNKLNKEQELPTQLYVSLNSPNKKLFEEWHRSEEKNAWEKFNKTLTLLPKLKTRRVIRMTLVRDLNMKDEQIKGYVTLIKKAQPDFIEVKGFMSVGSARKRLGYEMMPTHEEIKQFAEKLTKVIGKPYKFLDEHEHSRIVLLGKDKKKMKIKKSEI